MKDKEQQMKTKIFLAGILCACAMNAADMASLQKTLDENKLKANILEVQELGSGLDMVIVNINDQQVPFLATQDGKLMFQPETLLVQSPALRTSIDSFYEKLYKKEKAKIDNKLKSVFKKQYDKVFTFKAKKSTNKTIYIVSDPNCPYCKQEFAMLDKRLEDANVELLIVGFLSEDSMLRAANALKEKTASQVSNFKMLQKIYYADYKAPKVDTESARELTESVIQTGARSVPYIIEE